MIEIEFVDFDVVVYLHDTVIIQFGGDPGLRDAGLLESALMRARNKLASADQNSVDVFDLAAAYAFALCEESCIQ